MSQAIHLIEYGDPASVQLPELTAEALMRTGLVEVVPEASPGRWLLRPQGKVGAVSVGEFEVRVAPKVPINRIVFMLAHAMGGVTWQEQSVGVEHDSDVVHVLAEESLPVVRGRIRIGEQLKRRPGMWLPLEVSYDDFTIDTAENQILLAAGERLLRNPLVPVVVSRRLTALTHRLAEVTRLMPGAPLPSWRPSRLNLRYQSALRLAELVLAASSFEYRGGDVRIDGFVLDMPLIFEGFLTQALRAALLALHPTTTVRGQFPGFLDEDDQVPMRPDIVWLSSANGPLAVIDAKYKAERISGYPNADVYQALAYATALGLPDAHLVYARGNEPVSSSLIRGSGVRVDAHAIDLALPPADLLSQINGLARTIAGRACLASTELRRE